MAVPPGARLPMALPIVPLLFWKVLLVTVRVVVVLVAWFASPPP